MLKVAIIRVGTAFDKCCYNLQYLGNLAEKKLLEHGTSPRIVSIKIRFGLDNLPR